MRQYLDGVPAAVHRTSFVCFSSHLLEGDDATGLPVDRSVDGAVGALAYSVELVVGIHLRRSKRPSSFVAAGRADIVGVGGSRFRIEPAFARRGEDADELPTKSWRLRQGFMIILQSSCSGKADVWGVFHRAKPAREKYLHDVQGGFDIMCIVHAAPVKTWAFAPSKRGLWTPPSHHRQKTTETLPQHQH